MIHINKYIFYEVCNKNIDTYDEFISCIKNEYNKIMKKLIEIKTIPEIRYQIHKLVGIISSFTNKELLYLCKLILMIDKNDLNNTIAQYKPYIQQILDYNQGIIGL